MKYNTPPDKVIIPGQLGGVAAKAPLGIAKARGVNISSPVEPINPSSLGKLIPVFHRLLARNGIWRRKLWRQSERFV